VNKLKHNFSPTLLYKAVLADPFIFMQLANQPTEQPVSG
jgi:hypothetical protein